VYKPTVIILFCFCFVFYIAVGKSAMQRNANLPTTTERQTHARSLSTGKSAGIVSSNLCSMCRVSQVSLIVHGVTIGNIVLGTRDCGGYRDSTLRREGSTGRHVSVESGELCGSRKVEVQRHFII
jgi:hypothetical protein